MHDTLVVYVPSLRLLGCLQLWFGPSKRIVGGKHLEYFNFINAKTLATCGLGKKQAGCDTRQICPNCGQVLVVSPNTPPEVEGFQGHVAAKRLTDLCWDTHTQACRLRGEWQPPRIKLATWPGILCAHDFRSETTEQVVCQWWMHQKRASIRDRKRLKGTERLTERLWKTIYQGSNRMCMKHPEEGFVSFYFVFQFAPKGPVVKVVTMFGQQDMLLWRNLEAHWGVHRLR